MRWAALSRRPPILRGVSASQIRADHAANQPRIITATNRGLGARQANRSSGDLCVSPDNGALPGVQAVDSYNRHSVSRCSSAQYIFDFSVQVTSHAQRIGILIRCQEAANPVIRNMHAISALIHEDGNRSIRAGVRNTLCHFFHNERIPNDQTDNLGCVLLSPLANNHSMIELCKLHQTALTQGGLYGGL